MTLSIDERIERLWFRCFGMTYDEWKEEEHKRDKNGRFSSTSKTFAGGIQSRQTIPKINGDELGHYKDIKELRLNARLYAMAHLAGKQFTNESTGNHISVAMGGIKHTIAGAQDKLIKTIPAIPDLIKTANLIEIKNDKRGDSNIIAIEIYQSKLRVDKEECDIIITVKHYLDGRRYYDHGYMK